MVVNADEGPTLGGWEGVHVVTYDEEEPPEALAIPTQNSSLGPNNNVASNQNTTLSDGRSRLRLFAVWRPRLRQLSPGRHFALSLFRNTYMDLLGSRFAPGTKITLLAIRLCGNTELLVPLGTHVVVRRLLFCGSRDIHVDDDPERDPTEPAPRLTVTISSLCGNVRVRNDRNETGH